MFVRDCVVVSLFFHGVAAAGLAQSVTLEQARSLALKNHPAAMESDALVELGRAEVSRARTLDDPTLRLSAGSAEPRDAGASRSEHGWEISQEIPFPLSYGHRVRAARYAEQSFQNTAQAKRNELLFRVEVLYFTYSGELERRSLASESVSDSQKIFELTSRRVEVGESRETERIRSEVELLRAQRELAEAERDAQVSRDALQRIVGPGLPDEFSAEPLPGTHELLPDLETLRRRLEDRNPDLRSARSDALRTSEALRAARWSVVPNLTASYYDNREIDKTSQGVTLGFRIPLWNAGRSEVARSRGEQSLARAKASREAIELGSDLDRAYRGFTLASGQARTFFERLLPAARESLRLSRLGYEEGETAFMELLDAQRTFREVASESIVARRDAALALAEIRRLTGGEID